MSLLCNVQTGSVTRPFFYSGGSSSAGTGDRDEKVKAIFDFRLSPCSVCCVYFWVIPRGLNFIFRRFGTLSVPSS